MRKGVHSLSGHLLADSLILRRSVFPRRGLMDRRPKILIATGFGMCLCWHDDAHTPVKTTRTPLLDLPSQIVYNQRPSTTPSQPQHGEWPAIKAIVAASSSRFIQVIKWQFTSPSSLLLKSIAYSFQRSQHTYQNQNVPSSSLVQEYHAMLASLYVTWEAIDVRISVRKTDYTTSSRQSTQKR
jgi:hypothetical protein